MLGIYEEEEIRAVADKIRELSEAEANYTTAEMPEGVGAVYDKGYDNGYAKCTEDMQDALQAKYKAGYNSGLNDGVNSVMYSLYGSYVMPSAIVARSIIPFLWTSAGGVMAYFYDGAEYHYDKVSEIEFYQDFSMEIRSATYPGISYTPSTGWVTSWGKSFPDERYKVVTFTQPVEVGFEFYDNWLQVCKGAEETPYEVGSSVVASATLDALIDRSITSISSNAESVGYQAFSDCYELEIIDLPNVTTVADFAFTGCGVTAINLPNCTSLEGEMCFAYCTSLERIDLPKVETIGFAAFEGCEMLTSVTLRTGKVCIAVDSDAFTDTPISSGEGYIYVPADLVDSYKTATNWSKYAAQIKAIEE